MKLMMVWVVGMMVMNLFATPTVSNVSGRQRYPWNGLVDITCEVSGLEESAGTNPATIYSFVFYATNLATQARVPIASVTCNEGGRVTNGVNRLIWNAMADVGEVKISELQIRAMVVGREAVQLWEDGPYWATCNVGATTPEDAGLYFWWGDTVGYKRENNRWVASDGSSSGFSFTSENASTYGKDYATLQSEGWIGEDGNLTPEHDAATAHWGNKWRIPTSSEIGELNFNCKWTWTQRNGMNGYEVRGKGDYAKAWIFIPAAGHGIGSSLNFSGSDGCYWSSTPYSGISYGAYYLNFYSGNHYLYDNGRDYGFPVRAVSGFTK